MTEKGIYKQTLFSLFHPSGLFHQTRLNKRDRPDNLRDLSDLMDQRNQIDQRDKVNQENKIDEINLLDYWNVVWKWRKLIIIGTLTCMFVAGLVSLLKMRVYKAQATFFISKGQSARIIQSGDKVSMISESSEIHGDILTQMVKSKEVAQRVIKDLDLTATWKTKRLKDCESTLIDKMKIENLGPKGSGIFALSVTDKDPKLAFRIVESYLKNLQDLNNQINVGTVLNLLKFVENKLSQSKEDLSKAQGELREFKMKYGIAELKSQSEVIIHGIGELQMELTKTESNLSVLERQFTKNDPEVIRTRVKVAELKERIRQLQGGGIVSINPDHSERGKRPETPTIKEIPDLSMKLGELDQKVQIQSDIYKLLMVQYESAKIEATKEARIIQVIDKPAVPEDPEPRKAKQNTMIAGMVGLMLTLMIAFLLEYISKNRQQLFTQKSIERV